MTDLFELVLHHIEGTETEIQNWQTLDGIRPVEFQSFGPARWIESVHENGRLMAIDCLALILFVVNSSFEKDSRRVVEGWAAELRKAVSAGEIYARDPDTLLALETLPDGWEWLLSMADADKFIAARGMDWRFGEVASHLFSELEQAIQNRRFPPWARPAPAQDTATPAPVVADSPSNAPLPLATGDIAFCFDGIRWNEQEWRKPLGDKPKWLQSCVVTPAQRGVSETRWNPVLIAAWLVGNGHAKQNSIRARFQTKPQPQDWLEAWRTYEADNFDTP